MFKSKPPSSGSGADENVGDEVLNYRYCDLTTLPTAPQSTKPLVSLILSHNRFETIPPEICNHKTLKHLYLSSNQIKSLPPQITNLNKLETLCLEANQLTSKAIEDATLDKLTNLTKLLLVENQITTFPESICGISKLTRLGLSHNQITEIPDKITRLTSLQWLGLAYNKIKILNPLIAKIPTLRGVTLAGNSFENEWAEASKLRNLVSIMQISPENVPDLVEVAKQEHNLVITTSIGPTELEIKKLFAIPGPFSAGQESRFSMSSISTSLSSICNNDGTFVNTTTTTIMPSHDDMPTVPEGELPISGVGGTLVIPPPPSSSSSSYNSTNRNSFRMPSPFANEPHDLTVALYDIPEGKAESKADLTMMDMEEDSKSSTNNNKSEGCISDEVMICGTCMKDIDAEYVSACEKTYHPDCFTCATCGELLNEFFEYEGKAYCHKDIHQAKGLVCFSCNTPLTSDYLLASGKGFHTECFTCSKCKQNLETCQWMGDENGVLTCFVCLAQQV